MLDVARSSTVLFISILFLVVLQRISLLATLPAVESNHGFKTVRGYQLSASFDHATNHRALTRIAWETGRSDVVAPIGATKDTRYWMTVNS